jgi:hypothetical protein
MLREDLVGAVKESIENADESLLPMLNSIATWLEEQPI